MSEINNETLIEKAKKEIIAFLLKKLNSYYHILNNKHNKFKSKYQFLTPNDEAEHIKEYSIALEAALGDKKVRNIAVSGSYGSGKSSFIKTFEKNHENGVYKFLDISLARFNQENQENQKDIDLSLIEKSILEQMFYKVKSKKIPQSRLNKINRLIHLKKKIIFILATIFSFFVVFKPELLSHIVFIKDLLKLFQSEYLEYIPIGFLLVGAFFFIQKFIYLLSNTSIDKFNLKDLEIVSNDKKNESLLNRYLDEILYFFEQTTFNVIVFQDLDRFGNLDIFTKLRELNNFINNSEQMDGRDIKFIYAVKDEIFCNANERTKFFDFVIPIIPYINATNSKDKLLELFQDEIKPNFLYDISLYISDMRLLKNIYNEYKIYRISLDEQLDKTKLLAMIIYKNFEPQDFQKLHKYDGLVYDVFNKKSEYIKNVIDELNEKIESIKEEIQEIDKEPQETINELRKIYLLKIIEKFDNQFRGLVYAESKQFRLSTASEDASFEIIRNCQQIGFDNYQYNAKLNFKTIEKEVNPKYSYQEREQFIINKTNKKKNDLLKQINKLKDEKNEIENFSIQKIINTYKDVKIFDENFDKKPLLKYLISYGYINKDYDIYISNFFGKSITKADNDFLLNIKNNGKHFDFNYELNNLEEILKTERLEVGEFKKESILNFKLVTYIIEHKNSYPKQYIQIFKQLSNENEASIEFIFSYLDTQKNINVFIQGIVKYYSSIWKYIIDNKTDEEKSKYFYMLLDNLEFENILTLNVNDTLKNYMKVKTEFYHIPSESFNNKLKDVIKKLDIKFKLFKEHRERITPFKFIYENNFYELNQQMINYIMYVESSYDSSIYDTLGKFHYTTILNSKAEKLKQYIADNISEYIENANLNIDTNVEEIEDTVLKLLNTNSEELEEELKIKIIKHQAVKISKIDLVEEKNLWHVLLEENKLISSWGNVSDYYNYAEILDDSLIVYLNEKDNSKELLSVRIDNKYKEQHPNFNTKLLRELIECNSFDLSSYKNLVLKNGYHYEDLDLSKLDEEKINVLVNDVILKFGNINFELLRENSNNQHIVFLEKNINKFIEEYASFSIDSDDITKLLESKNISDKNKREIIELIDYDLISTSKIAKLIYSNIDKTTIKPYYYIKNMISRLESTESKVNLLVEQQSELNDEELVEMLELMPNEYSKIAKLDGKHTMISASDYNKKFIKLLYSREFITSDKPEKKNQIRLIIKNRN
ncbi:MAG TPA: hypothetical protein VLZ29_02700 [Sulfurimonas sp.]|uniref:YobI family P-loop NTPase n=1 Tax=Sulfurimonas sp. TaxID=2022749 RepID=UPI002CA898D4|nr:hypothetical protein [Sulfurimonas sp.]HUH42004.1 hypothetical protein [Sulfurimonas sp.]